MKKRPVILYVDPKSSNLKQFSISKTKVILFGVFLLLFSIFLLKFSVDFIVRISQNSEISRLRHHNQLLQAELQRMSQKVSSLEHRLAVVQNLDDEIRTYLDLPKISEDVRRVGVGGAEVDFTSRLPEGMPLRENIIQNWNVIDQLERELKLEQESYQKLLTTVERREDSLRYLPALKPVRNARLTDGFGKRIHPIFRRLQFHKGVDLACPSGTPIIAPADGYVTFAGRNGGYGLFVQINHKYGFETYYGHLRKIYVKRGQFVKRGDKIGEVGSTGLSTNPHLHYEVRYKGKPVNPLEFFFPE